MNSFCMLFQLTIIDVEKYGIKRTFLTDMFMYIFININIYFMYI